jgi:hypothetical protein
MLGTGACAKVTRCTIDMSSIASPASSCTLTLLHHCAEEMSDDELDFTLIVLEVRHAVLCIVCPAHQISLQIEGNLVRVPRRVFASSAIFKGMYSLPQTQDMPLDGSADTHPLKLESISYADFKLFVKAATAW